MSPDHDHADRAPTSSAPAADDGGRADDGAAAPAMTGNAPDGAASLEPAAAPNDGAAAPEPARLVMAPGAVLTWWVLGLSVTAVVAAVLQIALRVTDRGLFLLCLAFAVCIVAAWVDAATRRIPNVLTYPAILIGLGLHLALPSLDRAGLGTAATWIGANVTATSGAGGQELLMDGLFGFALCAAIGIVSFYTNGLGGGDVKLLGAMGAILGFDAVIPVLFNTLVVAAVVGLVNLALNGGLVARLQAVCLHLLVAAVTRSDVTKVYPFRKTESPFGISVLGGLIIAQFLPLYSLIM